MLPGVSISWLFTKSFAASFIGLDSLRDGSRRAGFALKLICLLHAPSCRLITAQRLRGRMSQQVTTAKTRCYAFGVSGQ